MTRVPPLYINLAGLGFFLVVAALAWRAPAADTARRVLGVLLLAGVGAEGVLFGYQLFVAQAFCGWCLTVFTLVALLNLLAGYSINRVTLFALVLVLGLVCDDPIVDVENIHRHFRLARRKPLEAILFAVNEVRPPVIFATLAVMLSSIPRTRPLICRSVRA